MLVYGDAVRHEAPADKIAQVRRFLGEAEPAAGIVRHGLLVAAMIEVGELAQGIADAAFEARGGRDARDPTTDAAMALCSALASLVVGSWRSGLAACPTPSQALACLDTLTACGLPDTLVVKQPEGFALYAVYPEAYLEAAAGLAGAEATVVGIRSVGTTLAAMLAAALAAPTPVTVRPVGHPFGRELAIDPGLDAELAAAAPGPFAVADEGPGLSGSSFLAVARHLRGLGAGTSDVHLFPSHANPPGPEASAAAQADWRRHPRHPGSTEDVLFREGAPGGGLPGWVKDLVGEPVAPWQDISGGAWRSLRGTSEAGWPPVHAWQERRKYLCRTATGTWLVRFAGLGRAGLAKEARGRELAAAGFVPEIAGWRHGFLVERWHGDAGRPGFDGNGRAAFMAWLGRYLAFRAAAFPAGPDRGASLAELHDMAVHNTGQALGREPAERLRVRLRGLTALAPRLRRVETDNRLHSWEWLQVENSILKADALDHCTGHDLIGCQDIGWDLAGAAVEFGMGEGELEEVAGTVERMSGRPVDPDLLRLFQPVYLAFQLGYYAMAAGSAAEPERARLQARSAHYAADLERWL